MAIHPMKVNITTTRIEKGFRGEFAGYLTVSDRGEKALQERAKSIWKAFRSVAKRDLSSDLLFVCNGSGLVRLVYSHATEAGHDAHKPSIKTPAKLTPYVWVSGNNTAIILESEVANTATFVEWFMRAWDAGQSGKELEIQPFPAGRTV